MEKENNIDISRSVSDVVAAARVLHVLNEKTFSWFHMRIIIIAGMGTRHPSSVSLSHGFILLTQLSFSSSFSFFYLRLVPPGFFTDAYDLFSISLLTKLIGRIYYQDDPYEVGGIVNPGVLPIGVDAAISAVALIGTYTNRRIILIM